MKAKPTTHSINKCAINHLFTQKHDTRPGKIYTQHQSDCGKQKTNILFAQFILFYNTIFHTHFSVQSLVYICITGMFNTNIFQCFKCWFSSAAKKNNNWIPMLQMWSVCCEQTKCLTLKLHFFLRRNSLTVS